MPNPLSRLKSLPWLDLLQVGGITAIALFLIDLLLLQGFQLLGPEQQFQLAQILLNSPLGILLPFAIMIGIGVLAVVVLERFYQHVRITAGVLWALLPCVALFLLLWRVLPLPAFLIGTSGIEWIAIALGIFTKGRRYWR